MIQREFP